MTDEEPRHRAFDLRDEAEAAFARGDYAQVVASDRRLEALAAALPGEGATAPDPRSAGETAQVRALGHQAAGQRRGLELDPVAVGAGVAATALYLAGWLIASVG